MLIEIYKRRRNSTWKSKLSSALFTIAYENNCSAKKIKQGHVGHNGHIGHIVSWLISWEKKLPRYLHNLTYMTYMTYLTCILSFDHFINSHIFHFHCCGENCRVNSLNAAPVATDGKIQQQVKTFIKWPGSITFSFIHKSEN